MIVDTALILGPVLVAWVAPAPLQAFTRRTTDPSAALLAWLVTIAAVVVTFTAGVVALLLPGTGPAADLGHLAHRCLLLVHHRHHHHPAGEDDLVGAAAAAGLLVAGLRLAVVARRRSRAQRESCQAHRDLLNLLGGAAQPGRDPVLRMPSAAPLAYSLGGRDGLVVISDGVQRLPEEQRNAVLSHETAHRRGRHHLIVAVVGALATTAPWVPLLRRAPQAVGLLVELCADAAAVRACGPSAVGAALIALSGAPHPAHTLSMAGPDVTVRLRRLHVQPPRHAAALQAAVAVTALSVPALVGGVVAVIGCG